jgi:ABC-type multidrug transport system fused ATPase/permease subunit
MAPTAGEAAAAIPQETVIPFWLHQFQLGITGSLSRLEAGQQAIKESVAKTNGAIADTIERVTRIESRNAERSSGCPLIREIQQEIRNLDTAINAIKSAEAAQRAAATQDATWLKRLQPFFALLIGFVLALMLGHGEDSLKWLSTLLRGH